MGIRSALVYSFGSRYATFAIQFVSTVIIARLLSPAEIGIYSVGAAVVAIAQTLRDFGTTTYVIQERELNDERLKTAFTITVIVAWTLALGLWAASHPLAGFYREDGVGEVLRVLAINFVLIPFGSITLALLRRNMKFQSLMYVQIVSTLVHSASAVVLAALGFGFASLAWAAVLGTAATVASALLIDWRWVASRPSLSERRRVLSFSLRSSAASIAAETGHAAPDLVIGRTLGMEANGLFARAYGFMQLFERIIQDGLRAVLLPYLANEVREGGALRAKLLHALENIAAVSWFAIGLMAVLAEPMIALLYGPQWQEAVPVAQVLALAMAIRCLTPTLAAALIAAGEMQSVMRISIWSAGAKLTLLALLSPLGLWQAALALCAAEAIGAFLMVRSTARLSIFTFADVGRILIRSGPVALVGASPALVAIMVQAPTGLGYIEIAGFLALASSASALAWLLMLWVTRTPPHQELHRLLGAIGARRRR